MDNLLGKFHFAGIPPAMCGVPQTDVTCGFDACGFLNVSVQESFFSLRQAQGRFVRHRPGVAESLGVELSGDSLFMDIGVRTAARSSWLWAYTS